ncbi:hypothetical protein MHYP_G00338630 [Metynnis hypsauchen]
MNGQTAAPGQAEAEGRAIEHLRVLHRKSYRFLGAMLSEKQRHATHSTNQPSSGQGREAQIHLQHGEAVSAVLLTQCLTAVLFLHIVQ